MIAWMSASLIKKLAIISMNSILSPKFYPKSKLCQMQRHNRAFNYLNVTKTSTACQCMELVIVWDKVGTKSSVGQYLVEHRTSKSEVLGSIPTKVLLIDSYLFINRTDLINLKDWIEGRFKQISQHGRPLWSHGWCLTLQNITLLWENSIETEIISSIGVFAQYE